MKKFLLLIMIVNLAYVSFFFYGDKIIKLKDSLKSQTFLKKDNLLSIKTTNQDEKLEIEIPQKEEKKMRTRDEIADEYKWNLSDIYPNWEGWEQDFTRLKELIAETTKYQGQISKDVKVFTEFMNLEEMISRLADKLFLYPYLQKDLDSTDEIASVKLQEIETVYSNYATSVSWVTPEILTIPKEVMISWIDSTPELEKNRFALLEIYRLQEHILSADKERLISYFGQYLGIPSDIYSELSTSDIKWNEIELSDGKKELVTNSVYSRILSTDRVQEDRKKAFEALYSSFDANKNTYSAIYRGILQRDYATAQARNYKTSLEKSLTPKNIPTDIYISLIEATKENTAPLKRYVALRKRALNLQEYHYYDNSINIIDFNKKFEYDEAKKIVLESVKPLGEDYYNGLNVALSSGWLDVYETKNKRSGAYSINIYDVHPYMLLNYNGTLDSVFTLAHELGHTMHSMLSTKNQPYPTSRYTIFVAEVASTFNERLLLNHMLKTTSDPKERIALIEQAIGGIVGTYYVQTLFADYEYEAHRIVENGGAITADVLSGIMEKLFKEYFGDELTIDELQKIIWARIPHFYNSPYYVYQYATSFAASANLFDRVTNPAYSKMEREQATQVYLKLLKSGGNNYPMEQLRLAGVDLSKKESFKAVAEEFNRLLDILERELNSLQGEK